MIGYKIYYSVEHKKFRYSKEPSKANLLNRTKDTTEHWYPTLQAAMYAVENHNKFDLDNVAICKQCGEPFMQTGADRDWYAERCLDIPRRCAKCRKEKK